MKSCIAACLLALVASAHADPGPAPGAPAGAGSAAVAPAAPPSSQDHARELFAQGKRYYDVADYAHAIDAWKQAYVAQAAPILLFNIAQAYRLAGDCTNAMRFYANYEREQPSPPNRDELEQAKQRCMIAQKPAFDHPPDKPPITAPPADHAPATTGQLRQSDLDSNAPPPHHELRDEAPPPGRGLEVTGASVTGVGLALAITGAVLASKASHDASDIADYRGPWNDAEAKIQSSGKRDATIGAITLSVGIAALVVGPGLYYLGHHRRAVHELEVVVAPGHTELSWSAHF